MPDTVPSPTASRPTLDYRSRRRSRWNDVVTSFRRWYRTGFSRDSIIDKLKTMLWVVPLTLLVWVYAEREQVDLTTGLNTPLPIDVRLSAPNRVVTVMHPPDLNVIADLSGPHRGLEAVLEHFLQAPTPLPVEIDIDPKMSPGAHELSMALLLSKNTVFSSDGISVGKCNPDTLKIIVDELIERDVRIISPAGISNLEGPSVFDPPTVKVRGPKSLLDSMESQGKLTVTADLSHEDALKTPGQHNLLEVPLLLPSEDRHVSLDQRTVHAAIKVRQADVSLKLDAVPVFVTLPQNLVHRGYDVDYKPVTYNVTVVGPPDKIELLKSGNLQPAPTARLRITTDDLPAGKPHSRRLDFDLPDPAIHVTPEDAQREVDFKLVERTPPES